MSSRKRNRSQLSNNHNIYSPLSKRHKPSQRSQSQWSTQNKDNVFPSWLKYDCKVKIRSNASMPLELDNPEWIQDCLQKKLKRDDEKRSQFCQEFEDFMERQNGQRLKQFLLPTIPKSNDRTSFVSEAWKEMSQINENDQEYAVCARTQPSMIRILLNCDCLQIKIRQYLDGKLDEYLNNENEAETVLSILQQFAYLDHVVGDAESFTDSLFGKLEMGNNADTQRSIIALFDQIIMDNEHEFVAEKLLKLLDRTTDVTQAIIECLASLKISDSLRKKTQKKLLESLETTELNDLDCIIRYLLHTVSEHEIRDVLNEMRLSIPFNTDFNFKIFCAFGQCFFASKCVVEVIKNSNKQRVCSLDLWLLFLMYDKSNYSDKKIEKCLIKKIEQQHMSKRWIKENLQRIENKQCLKQMFAAILFLSERLLENKSNFVADVGKTMYGILYSSMNSDNNLQRQCITSIIAQIGSNDKMQTNNSLNLLLELTKNNAQSIRNYTAQILGLIDFIQYKSFNLRQIRLLYLIFSSLSIYHDSNDEIQIANNLFVIIQKQMATGQNEGIIGCIQLILALSTKMAFTTKNAKMESKKLIKKLMTQQKAFDASIMIDELCAMVEKSRLCNGKYIEWNRYSEQNDDFYPLHGDIIHYMYQQIEEMMTNTLVIVDSSEQSQNDDKIQFIRNGLKQQMWLGLKAQKRSSKSQMIDSEATEYTEDQSQGAAANEFVIKITPNFVAQHRALIMWIICPLLRLFGIMNNAKYGTLERIDAFLSAPFIMFDVDSLTKSELIDLSPRSRQIIGDSLFTAINCLRELLNIFCSELVDILKNEDSDESMQRRRKIESKLCIRFDQMICLELKLESFMTVNLNKDFIPSFIPSKSKQKVYISSPPWKKKMILSKKQSKNKKKQIKIKKQQKESSSSEEEENEESDYDKNKNKKKKKSKKKKKKKKVKKAPKPRPKKKEKQKSKSPLTKIDAYFRCLDLNVSVLTKYDILDINQPKKALKRMSNVSMRNIKGRKSALISLRAFHKIFNDFSKKVVEICDSQSARRGFSNGQRTENIIDYSPVSLLNRYVFIFEYIGKQIRSLIAFRNKINEEIEDEDHDENIVAHYRSLSPFIEDCFRIFVLCITKLFKYKPFELPSNKQIFCTFLFKLCAENSDDDAMNESFTRMSMKLVALLEKMIVCVEDINIAVAIVNLIDVIMKNGLFDKNMRVDSKIKISDLCDKMLRGEIGEGYMSQVKNASNVAKIVSFYLKNTENALNKVHKMYVSIDSIEDKAKNEYSLLTKKTIYHFLKPTLEYLLFHYAALKETDVRLKGHSQVLKHFGEIMTIVFLLDEPKSIGHLMVIGAALSGKCIQKMFGKKYLENQNKKYIMEHLNAWSQCSKTLHKLIHRVRRGENEAFVEKANRKWLKIREKTKKLNKNLENLMMRTNTYLVSIGNRDGMIRTLRLVKNNDNEENEEQKEEENEDEDEDDDEDEDNGESGSSEQESSDSDDDESDSD